MKLSFLLWLTRRRFYKEQHTSHMGRTTFHFCRSFRSCIASAPAQKQQTSAIFLTQAYSSRRTQHAPGSGASSSQTPRAVKSQPLREKFDAGTLKCVQIHVYACTWYTHAYIFKKKNSRFWGKVTRSGDRKQGIFLVRPYPFFFHFSFLAQIRFGISVMVLAGKSYSSSKSTRSPAACCFNNCC